MKAIVKESSNNNFFQNIKDFFSNIFGTNLYTNDNQLDEIESYRNIDSNVVDELLQSSKQLDKQALQYRSSIGSIATKKEEKIISKQKKSDDKEGYTIKPINPIISKDSNDRNIMDFSER